MITTAAIMAAGWGRRLGELTEYTPKAMLEIGPETLLGRSVRLLKEVGVRRIVIGTGYCGQVIEEFFAGDPAVHCVRMDRFRDTNSMYTLYGLREALDDDFLLLESDILYEGRALSYLLDQPEADVVLASPNTDSGDEVYIETDDRGRLVNMSKDSRVLKNAVVELVGLVKVSRVTYADMCTFMARHLAYHDAMYYEGGLVEMAAQRDIKVANMPDLTWCEIDDLNHLKRAQETIWPALVAKEGLKEKSAAG